jgi:hypothetical protein
MSRYICVQCIITQTENVFFFVLLKFHFYSRFIQVIFTFFIDQNENTGYEIESVIKNLNDFNEENCFKMKCLNFLTCIFNSVNKFVKQV